VTNSLESLPADISRHRILSATASAAFWGVSLPTWRRMNRLGQVPSPVRLSARRLGWKVGDLADGLTARQSHPAA
jgi:predicted DNA-binding transcriptional regulator AlpA